MPDGEITTSGTDSQRGFGVRRSSAPMTAAVLLLLIALAAGCGSEDSATTTPQAPATATTAGATSTEAVPVEPLVGEWRRVHECADLVRALKDAGLEEFTLQAIAGAELVPGAENDPDSIEDPAHPCKGAVPREHSHFFTAEGPFGSRNEKGEQVDDGTYEVVDDRTFVLNGDVTFHYRIRDDTIMFDPVMPADCSTKRCRETQAYAVSVAFPGETWERAG